MNARKKNARDSSPIQRLASSSLFERGAQNFRDKRYEIMAKLRWILGSGSSHRHKLSVGVEFVTVMRDRVFKTGLGVASTGSQRRISSDCETCIVHFSATSSPLFFSLLVSSSCFLSFFPFFFFILHSPLRFVAVGNRRDYPHPVISV